MRLSSVKVCHDNKNSASIVCQGSVCSWVWGVSNLHLYCMHVASILHLCLVWEHIYCVDCVRLELVFSRFVVSLGSVDGAPKMYRGYMNDLSGLGLGAFMVQLVYDASNLARWCVYGAFMVGLIRRSIDLCC